MIRIDFLFVITVDFYLILGGYIMNKKAALYKSAATAACIALCVILPFAFHMIPKGGVLFSPMHLPVLLCGITCGPQYGLICGILGPLLSGAVSGMPTMANLPSMMIELAVYGLVIGLMMHFVHTGKQIVDLYVSMLVAMLSGRIIAGIVRAFIFTSSGLSLKAWATAYFVSCFPAIVLQLLLIPFIYTALQRADLLPNRNKQKQSK